MGGLTSFCSLTFRSPQEPICSLPSQLVQWCGNGRETFTKSPVLIGYSQEFTNFRSIAVGYEVTALTLDGSG